MGIWVGKAVDVGRPHHASSSSPITCGVAGSESRSRSRSRAGTGEYHLLLGVSSIAPSFAPAADPAFRPLVAYRLINTTMSVYRTNAMLRACVSVRVLSEPGQKEERDGDAPEHDEDVRDVVHALVVHKVQLLVRGGHEEQPGGDEELADSQP